MKDLIKDKFRNYLLVLSLLLVSPIYETRADEIEYTNMEQMMGSIKLEKKQVEGMLDKMIVSGRISSEEGVEAKRALASMKENDLENLKAMAIAEVKNKKLLGH
ncbi:MAG: hypothetical protein EHM20_10685 [Alphaproteobacteria bacterium]|nr:MAG: hypothetical protein EHM20_10685 [Alphaproteobacteria bacterium]